MKTLMGVLAVGVWMLAPKVDGEGIKAGKGALLVATNGLSLTPSVASCPASRATGEPFWSMTLEPDAWPATTGQGLTLTDLGQTSVRREALPDGVRLSYDTLTDGSRTFRISLALEIRAKGDGFAVTGAVTNGARGWLVTGLTAPALNGIAADLATHPVLLPEGFGKRVNRVPKEGEKQKEWSQQGTSYEMGTPYPGSRGTMQWCAFAGRDGGLYFGSHDPEHRSKRLSLRYDPATRLFGLTVRHDFFCRSGERVAVPPVLIQPYEGSWHVAARFYSGWANAAEKARHVPAWARDASGWLLCILKQQNGEVMWKYPSLTKLCDVADARGLDVLGLFGWTIGGHDHLYPDYVPCPDMGGAEAMKQALKEVRRRGKRTIIYANGQLQERDATEFWKRTGKDIAILQRNGETYQQTYHKYSDIPIYRFDLGCLCAQTWYDRMLSLALQANDLGADGILYDQLAMMSPMACYGEGHGHPVPCMVHEVERPVFLRRIAEHMRKINPDFIVMTEGLHDCALDAISMFHGCELGMFYASAGEILVRMRATRLTDAFPEMFRYTYPEVMSTVRVPAPMMDRGMANYTCVYGLRYEIETRYAPDVAYLLENRVPEAGDYRAVVNKPDVGMMRATPPEEAARYLKQVIGFQRANADCFWRGRYTDSEGFTLQGEDLVAKGFEADGGRFGVVVWNPFDKTARFTVSVPEARLISAAEPGNERVEPFSDLPPNTVRLLRWQRK
ncbi:MAG TPA: DUF6259 domain-containing protein [Kiritimatiellia bacterium]|nr:DUF6259 domain-containing protein [Kiritimatiellia bacterium]HPS07973.1 DUF6259 domain-containing protein [Kiritimatiellia bacterium]